MRGDDGAISVRPNPYARKDSGSFFTPQELVDLIIDRTLGPLAEERLEAFEAKSEELRRKRRPKAKRLEDLRALDPAQAVLDLKVLDPAMGSGHFLVTAVDFLSDRIAELVEYVPAVPDWLDDPYESPVVGRIAAIRAEIESGARESNWVLDSAQLSDLAIIRRMVLKRCIYGVDKNPLTVELAKVSLWLHSFTVGAPLSFLNHHLRAGDSLLGLRVAEATTELNQLAGLSLSSATAGAEAATGVMHEIEEMSDADIAEVHESAALFHDVEETTAPLRGLLDLLCGMRWLTADMKVKDRTAFWAPLLEVLDARPADAYDLLIFGPEDETPPAFGDRWREARDVADEEGFLHWEVAFPGVWTGWGDAQPAGGFDAIIGNPPWDRIKLQEVEWFALRAPAIAQAPTAAARRAAIDQLREDGSPWPASSTPRRRAPRPWGGWCASRATTPAGRRRHQPVLALRRARHGAGQAGRLRGPAHPLGHLRRQDRRPLLPVRLHERPRRRRVRLREPPPRHRTAAVLPGRGLPVQVLHPHPGGSRAPFRSDRLRLLPPRR